MTENGNGNGQGQGGQFPLEVEGHDSAPTIPLNEVQQQRCKELARDLEKARVQGYVEANFAIRLLDLVRELLPLVPGLGA